ncbi:DUF4363 family protein [Oceanobacillus profundus]|uniref:DUF4363 family protein n=1 Tax=Oceanobacillus TaxID=182709 RepID=UPI00203CA6F9|nr:DUF4363 family protein [Oceanobacillus profundus]MBR3119059.1 DUF4363 family protein [Oceanobacillus sp.]MCM3398255.1 DUF4363 family protein [Oceanobacillus profundus]MDO6447841.1 DUF4363 family protein [Oceanobacillus profundus]
MKKIKILLASLAILLAGCTNQVGGDYFFNHIDQIEQEIDQSNWDKIAVQTDELKKMYKKNRWKIQLLGDEGEYEELHISINILIAAVLEEDSTSARLELATVRSILEDIYSL